VARYARPVAAAKYKKIKIKNGYKIIFYGTVLPDSL
jgi:hypothetical protein